MRTYTRASMTLRAKLTSIVLALVACALLISDVASVAALRAYMLNELDKDLVDGRAAAARRIEGDSGTGTDTAHAIPRANDQQLLNDFFVEVRRRDGTVDDALVPSVHKNSSPVPDIPQTAVMANLDQGPFTVAGKDAKNTHFRTVAITAENGTDIIVVSVSLETIANATARLILAEIVVTTAMLTGLGFAAWWIVRHELRPLDAMAATAGAIAQGDLSQRVDERHPATEVGRLGTAFNSMLVQIETSFAERQASEDRLRRFAADASHELRTPLTAIRGYAEIYRQGAIRDEQHLDQVMLRIEKEATRMGVMVEDLLLLARLDQNRPFDIETLDLSSILNDVVADARATTTSHHIDVETDRSTPRVEGDAARLHQVFSNLVNNALSHTPAGTTITVQLAHDEDTVIATVRDNGPGLDEEAAQRIFERFYRVDAGRSRNTGGTGLGLSIVKAIVERHGGTVEVETKPGAGAAFIVKLPAPPA